jgi:hypothetical protein
VVGKGHRSSSSPIARAPIGERNERLEPPPGLLRPAPLVVAEKTPDREFHYPEW